MYKTIITQAAFLIIALLHWGCTNDEPGNPNPTTRTFYMGTTPWPADLTIEEVDNAYHFINNHCDIVSHHFDEGIPYDEAYNGTSMPSHLLENVETRKTKTSPNTKVFLSVSALSISRTSKAAYYNNATPLAETKTYWEGLPFDDPKIVTAYFNYICWLIDQLNPIYVNYGVESNGQLWVEEDFLKYKTFLSQVYPKLKSKYPTTPFFVSFMVDESTNGYNYASQLTQYSDFIGLSAYPYIGLSSSSDGGTDPSKFPSDYFDRFINLAPSKPLAFAETGYIAQDLAVPAYNLNKKGNETWQNDYLELVLKICEEKQAKLFIWFCHKDYDALANAFINQGVDEETLNLLKLWRDTGLTDENGNARQIYNSWLAWMEKEKL
jgi:hypothetical protein